MLLLLFCSFTTIVGVSLKFATKTSTGMQVPNLYCIGDANGKLMLAHAASAQGISGKCCAHLFLLCMLDAGHYHMNKCSSEYI